MEDRAVIGLDVNSLKNISYFHIPCFQILVISLQGVSIWIKGQTEFCSTEHGLESRIIHH